MNLLTLGCWRQRRRDEIQPEKQNGTKRSEALFNRRPKGLFESKNFENLLWRSTFHLKKGRVLNILPPDLVVQRFLIEPQGFFVGQQLQHSEGEITF